MVTCHYCRTQNSADDHRCSRCGRRLSDEPVRFPVHMGSVAPELKPVQEAPPEEAAPPRPGPRLVEIPTTPAASAAPAEALQPSLFGPMPVTARQPRTVARPGHAARRRNDAVVQQRFEFTDGARALPSKVQAALYTNASVAPAVDRVTAASIDALIPLAGFAVFLMAVHFTIGDLPLDTDTLPLLGAAAVLIALFYRLVGCLGNMDTLGMQWTGLRLLDFDGRLPTRRARFQRYFGGLVSLMSAGMGLVWSLADQERLTWHDHISRTFPTPRRRGEE